MAAAAELLALPVDVIGASLTPAAVAARRATDRLPIVMSALGDPLGSGLVASLARPGGLLAGTPAAREEVLAKQRERLAAAVPQALVFFSVLLSRAHPARGFSFNALLARAGVLRRPLERLEIAHADELDAAVAQAQGSPMLLLDVMMPGLSGYDVCRALRADPAHTMLPIVLVTALDPAKERVNGLEAGADDLLGKPIHPAERMAQVKSLLRIKSLYDEVQRQKKELAQWNRALEQRVADGVLQLERVGWSKRFFSPQLAEAILAGGADDPLKSHRREITVVFLDLRGFTAFTESADPEEVMAALADYHRAMGRLILAHEGTLERFSGDGLMVFFNDPVVIPDPAPRAVRMALAMQREMVGLSDNWRRRGYQLQMGVGIAQGALLGAGDEFRGQLEPAGELMLKGLQRPVPAWRVRVDALPPA